MSKTQGIVCNWMFEHHRHKFGIIAYIANQSYGLHNELQSTITDYHVCKTVGRTLA
jgi:hypothetical protein